MAFASHTLHIDWTRCDGRGLCAEILEHALTRDDWGYPVSRRGDPARRSDVPIASDEVQRAEEAVALCPVLALRLDRSKR
jgi:ferredoxin